MHYKLLERELLHEVDSKLSTSGAVEANLRQTIRVSLQTDLNQTVDEANEDDRSTAYYLPGDHLAVYPQNEAALVEALIKRLTAEKAISSSSAADRPYLVKIRSQQSMDNGGGGSSGAISGLFNGHKDNNGDEEAAWSLHDRLPAPVSLREALTRYLDITTPPTQQFLTILADTAENSQSAERMKHLAKDSTDYETWKAKSFPNLIEVRSRIYIFNLTMSLLGTTRLFSQAITGANLHTAASTAAPLLLHLILATLQLCLSTGPDSGRSAGRCCCLNNFMKKK